MRGGGQNMQGEPQNVPEGNPGMQEGNMQVRSEKNINKNRTQ